jgi:prophage antirepressor-like protein
MKNFGEHNIPIFGTTENPLFRASDIGALLEIKKITKTLESVDEDEKVLKFGPSRGGELEDENAHALGGGGGVNREQYFLTVNGLYEVLFISRKPLAKQFKKWVKHILEEIRLNGKYELTKQIELSQKELETKEQQIEELKKELEAKKHSKDTAGSIYIATNRKEETRQIYKVGETANEKARLSTMNTSESDSCIYYVRTFETTNRHLAEKLIHTYLNTYKFNYNKEFYNVDLKFLIDIVDCFVTIVNEMCKVNTENKISISDFTTKLKMLNTSRNIENIIDTKLTTLSDQIKSMTTTTNNHITINMNVNPAQFRYFTHTNYIDFIKDTLAEDDGKYILTEDLRKSFVNWIHKTMIKTLNGTDMKFKYSQNFKREFLKATEQIINCNQRRISRAGKIRGFEDFAIKNTI